METDKMDTKPVEKRYFYYLDSGTGVVSVVEAESREHISVGAWWVPEKGETAMVDSTIFTDRKKLNLAARELILNLKIRAMRVESNYEATVNLADWTIVE